ncbi:2-hydroxycarboxylate transporter family protein [Clostridium algoriphilum]|uniref:2-hydroxycarboxylate transporter family protein n=1 Tax=Clostridium algoriphilum TaxID=198347 RepID=UPI001CF3808D|nr:2-hydroxycarboxylate transporter family protein [Clostridium algoriphilum]MCB2295238.1 2-hydroxycarboxylate transporter family protein [Clostridium algoriphilum]
MKSDVNVKPKNSPSFISKITTLKIGVIPLPLYLVISCVIFAASFYGKLPADMIGGFATIMIMGILLGEAGKNIPILKNIGGPAILALFVPSYMLYANLLNPSTVKSIVAVMKTSNFLYLYISVLVAGSILGMNRKVLIKGFTRMFVPLIVGTIAAVSTGILVGLLFGYTPYRTFFFIVMPIIGGGIGEGILPLTLSYSEILHQGQQVFIAQMIPAALLGNVVAIISAGLLKRFGEKRPELTGNGTLVKSGDDSEMLNDTTPDKAIDFSLMGAGLLIACTLFIFGSLLSKFIPIPGPVIMIFTAAILKILKLMPEKMEQGAYHLYKFISGSLTFPLMIGLGVLYVPWGELVNAITPAYITICASTVLAMISSGFFIGKYVNMYPVDAAIVTACHSGLGGTGDVAILSSSDRMELMPFAQIATRIGGASMVVIAALLMKFVS